MRNLAGYKCATQECINELERAEIDVVKVEPTGEVMSEVGGLIITKWGNIKLRRAWTYWVAEGIVPLDIANYLYKHPEGKISVRVNGDCGCPDPKYCFEHFDSLTFKQLDPRDVYAETLDFYERKGWFEDMEEYKNRVLVLEDCPKAFGGVKNYHIDDQAGLLLFSMVMRGLIGTN